MIVRFIVYPNIQIRHQVARFANEVRMLRLNELLIVNGKQWLPHATLCKAKVDGRSLRKLYRDMGDYLKEVKPFSVTANRIVGEHEGTVGWEIGPKKKLEELRQSLHERLKSYAIGEPFPLRRPYWPHMTIARFKDQATAQIVAKILKSKRVTFPMDVIATIAPPGKLGQVPTRILNSWKL